jgi:hemoglobin
VGDGQGATRECASQAARPRTRPEIYRGKRVGLTAARGKSNLWLPTELIWEGRLLLADLPGEGQMTEHDAPAPERPPLYDRLGGVYNIATVVDDFIDRVMTDPRLNANPRVDEAHHRVSPAGFKYLVTEMVCWATGGPQRYSGRPMGDSHRHLMITAGEWQAFLDDFQQTLDKFGVPQPEQEELNAIVESTREAIVVAPLQEGPMIAVDEQRT